MVSQPFWILAFNADDILGNLTNWNIFFTLFLSLLAMWGLTTGAGGSLCWGFWCWPREALTTTTTASF